MMGKVSRRDFIRKSTLATAGLGLGSSLKAWAHHSENTTALVIGSGYGGAVAARRLAEAGIDTVVLERGRRWVVTPEQDTFSTFDNPDGRATWLSPTVDVIRLQEDAPVDVDVFTGLMEVAARRTPNGINALAWAGVGGGSLGNNGLSVQPSRALFERSIPTAIPYDEMEEVYYPRALEGLQAEPMPDDILASEFYESKRANLEQMERSGFTIQPLPLQVDWDVVREEIAGNRRPSAIDGQSWFGLNSGAKMSLDKTYLAEAEASGLVKVLPLHVVTDIIELYPHLFAVAVNQINDVGEVERVKYFVCSYLFFAAGSLGTPELLSRARAKRTLPRLNKWIGRRWSPNGDFGLIRAGLPISPAGQGGGPCGQFIAEDLENPFAPVGLTELVLPKNLAQNFPAPGGIFYIGMGYSPPIGRFFYDAKTDSTSLSWDVENVRATNYKNSVQHMADTIDQNNPDSFTIAVDFGFAAHPLGGAVMGLACDFYGRVKGHRGIYVVDGSFIPGTTGTGNPSLTITALAERSLEHVIEHDVYR